MPCVLVVASWYKYCVLRLVKVCPHRDSYEGNHWLTGSLAKEYSSKSSELVNLERNLAVELWRKANR